MPRARVLVTDYAWPSLERERDVLDAVGAELVAAETGDEAELVELARDADAILTNWKRVPPAALDAAPRCLVVSRYGVGVDNIPVEHATRLGILVANVPDFCVDEASDHALALVLACARRIVAFARSTQAGGWDLQLGFGIRRLRGQTLGLIGYGSIAKALVPKALALGLRVVASTPRLADGREPNGVETTNDLGRLLRESDFVSLHAPATPQTRDLIGERELRTMKPTAWLVNTARGALVDEEALDRALAERWIAGAALDVLCEEPPAPGHPLLARDNVIVTPHAAFYSEESIADVATRAAENVRSVLRGDVPATVVNSDVTARPSFRLGARR